MFHMNVVGMCKTEQTRRESAMLGAWGKAKFFSSASLKSPDFKAVFDMLFLMVWKSATISTLLAGVTFSFFTSILSIHPYSLGRR